MGAQRFCGVQFRFVMAGGADDHIIGDIVLWAEPVREMNAFGSNLRRQPDIGADQQHKAAACANGLQLRRQRRAAGRFIIPQDDGGPRRQRPCGQKGVRRARAVCQESQRERSRSAGRPGSPFEPLCGGC